MFIPINLSGKMFLSLLIPMAIATSDCRAQINDFRDILSTCIPNKTFVTKQDGVQSERTFLGYIKDEKGKVIFYVCKEFYSIPAAIVQHGHSRILFFTREKRLASEYYLDDPAMLPYKLERGNLYFKYRRNGKELIRLVKIRRKLPIPICVAPNNCYWPCKQ